MAEMKESYKLALPQKIDELTQLHEKEAIPKLIKALHKLAGSAGLYGFADLGQEARQLENACKSGISREDLEIGLQKLSELAKS